MAVRPPFRGSPGTPPCSRSLEGTHHTVAPQYRGPLVGVQGTCVAAPPPRNIDKNLCMIMAYRAIAICKMTEYNIALS